MKVEVSIYDLVSESLRIRIFSPIKSTIWLVFMCRVTGSVSKWRIMCMVVLPTRKIQVIESSCLRKGFCAVSTVLNLLLEFLKLFSFDMGTYGSWLMFLLKKASSYRHWTWALFQCYLWWYRANAKLKRLEIKTTSCFYMPLFASFFL